MFSIKNVRNLTVNIDTGGKKELSADDFLSKIFKGPPPPFDKILKDLGGECGCVLNFRVDGFHISKEINEAWLGIVMKEIKEVDKDIVYRMCEKYFKHTSHSSAVSYIRIPIKNNATCVLDIIFLFLYKCLRKDINEIRDIGKDIMKLDNVLIEQYIATLNAS